MLPSRPDVLCTVNPTTPTRRNHVLSEDEILQSDVALTLPWTNIIVVVNKFMLVILLLYYSKKETLTYKYKIKLY